jgi:hypothetical protein
MKTLKSPNVTALSPPSIKSFSYLIGATQIVVHFYAVVNFLFNDCANISDYLALRVWVILNVVLAGMW